MRAAILGQLPGTVHDLFGIHPIRVKRESPEPADSRGQEAVRSVRHLEGAIES